MNARSLDTTAPRRARSQPGRPAPKVPIARVRQGGGDHTVLPAVPRTWVERPGLFRLLDEATRQPLTVVVGPAGAGKTSTVGTWCHARPGLDPLWVARGNGLTLNGFAAVLLDAAGVPPMDEAPLVEGNAAERLSRRLAGVRRPRLLAVDDAHLLTPACYTLIDALVEQVPDAVRLVLVCRWDPPVSRVNALVHGRLTEIRGEAFRLTDEETRRLVAAHAPALAAPVVDLIVERTQGWPALVTLAAHTVAGDPRPLDAAHRLGRRGAGVTDLLVDQVFASLADPVRHLLLCVAAEEEVTEQAAERLTCDPSAGATLAELAAAGLLVTRVDGPAPASLRASAEGAPSRPGQPGYRVHPLLREVVARRLRTGGVAVAQARASVRRAALGDLVRGEVPTAFRRLVEARAWPDAVDLLARHGEHLILDSSRHALDEVAAAAPELVEGTPRAWLPLALCRWVHGDTLGADGWIRRILELPGVEGVFHPVQLALLRLLHTRACHESPETGIAVALAALDRPCEDSAPTLRAWTLLEVALAEQWLGRFADADRHLAWAAAIARGASRRMLVAIWSHQAQVGYLAGRYEEAATLAQRVLEAEGSTRARPVEIGARARIVRALTTTSDAALLEPDVSADALVDGLIGRRGDPLGPRGAPADPATSVLALVRMGRALRAHGGAAEAAALLESPLALPPQPRWVRVLLAVEVAATAALRRDAGYLRALAARLEAGQAPLEFALVAAAAAACSGSAAEAERVVARALAGPEPGVLAETRCTLDLVHAQLLDTLGDGAGARERVCAALAASGDGGTRGGVAPSFLQWLPDATSVAVLLRGHDTCCPAEARARWAPFAASGPYAASDRCDPVGAPVPPATDSATGGARTDVPFFPHLTARERQVLLGLSRGNTYADIANELGVSENTVKTHVSAVYAKLGATRRSDALKRARALRLV